MEKALHGWDGGLDATDNRVFQTPTAVVISICFLHALCSVDHLKTSTLSLSAIHMSCKEVVEGMLEECWIQCLYPCQHQRNLHFIPDYVLEMPLDPHLFLSSSAAAFTFSVATACLWYSMVLEFIANAFANRLVCACVPKLRRFFEPSIWASWYGQKKNELVPWSCLGSYAVHLSPLSILSFWSCHKFLL